MTPWRIVVSLVAALLWTAAHAQPTCPPATPTPTAQTVQAAMKAARDRGFLWRIRKGGHTSYLYGTIHVGRLEWVFYGTAINTALRETDTLALELDPSDPAMQKALSTGHATPAMPEALRERLERQYAAACVPRAAMASMHPLMQALALSFLAGRWEGLDPQFAQEFVLAGAARAAGRPVVSLETAKLQLEAVIPKDEAAMWRMLERTLELLENQSARPLIARLGRAWENGDLADIEHYEQWCQCTETDEERAQMRRLNDERNPRMAQRIDALHTSGKKVFAAVGALHMTGPNALPTLLAQRGYKVERITFGQ